MFIGVLWHILGVIQYSYPTFPHLVKWLPSEVKYELNLDRKWFRTAGETSVDLGEGGKIAGAFLGAFFTVSDPAKNFKGKIGKLAKY